MPRDGTATRSAILEAALSLLGEGGLAAFSIERVATKAGVAKGLVLYHYRSRARFIEVCAERLQSARAERLRAAGRGTGIAAVDALWAELTRQQEDGTARAWLSLAAVGAVRQPTEADVIEQARNSLLNGCAAALAAGGDRGAVREAYEALALALLRMEES